MKKYFIIFVAILFVFILTGCSTNDTEERKNEKKEDCCSCCEEGETCIALCCPCEEE